MKTARMVLGVSLALACACARNTPKQDTFPGPQLGESRKSPGADPTKQPPVTPDDPRVMNVSASISPEQAARAAQAPTPPTPTPTRESATSSTPVTQPRDIAPPSTTTDANRPTVTSPPPPTTR